MKRGDEASRSAAIAVLTQVNPLPGPQCQATIADGNRNGGTQQRRLHVGWHVIRSLQSVYQRQASFRGDVIKKSLHIDANIRIGILIDGEAGGRMQDEKVK